MSCNQWPYPQQEKRFAPPSLNTKFKHPVKFLAHLCIHDGLRGISLGSLLQALDDSISITVACAEHLLSTRVIESCSLEVAGVQGLIVYLKL